MKKNSFSILELLISFFLISLIALTTSFSFGQWIQKNQFKHEVQAFREHLQFAYDLVLDYDLDLTLHFYYKNGKLISEMSADHFPSLAHRYRVKTFSHLSKLTCTQNEPPHTSIDLTPTTSQPFSITFSYYGGHSPPTLLELHGKGSANSSFLIQGFPHVIEAKKSFLSTS